MEVVLGLGVYFGVVETGFGVVAATAAFRKLDENCRELHPEVA